MCVCVMLLAYSRREAALSAASVGPGPLLVLSRTPAVLDTTEVRLWLHSDSPVGETLPAEQRVAVVI